MSPKRSLPGLLWTLLACAVSTQPASRASAQAEPQFAPDFRYEFHWIHDASQWAESGPYAFNQHGEVLGRCYFHDAERHRVFIWRQDAGPIYLDALPTLNESGALLSQFREFNPDVPGANEFFYHTVHDMNDARQIAGIGYYVDEWPAEPAVRTAFRWTPAAEPDQFAVLEQIDVPQSWGHQTTPLTINNAGDIAGYYNSESGFQVFLRIENGAESQFVSLGRPDMPYTANTQTLSNRFALGGQDYIRLVVSHSYTYAVAAGSRVLRYTAPITDPESGVFEDLGTFMRDSSGSAGARAINDLGEIAGAATAELTKRSTTTSAFRYSDAAGMVNLGTLADSGSYRRSWGYGINNWGEVVGASQYYDASFPCRPFLYTDEFQIRDLIELTDGIPWDAIDLGRFRGVWINDTGDIVGPLGFSNHGSTDHPSRAFLLHRVPATPTWLFVSTDTPKSILDRHPARGVQDTVSTLTIAEAGMITSLALALNISHDRPSDLSAELRAPNQESRVLFEPGGFDRQFTVSFPEGVALAGDWVLILRDHVRQVAGTLNQWTIQVQVPQ